jgi:hypothetical protein
MQKTMKKMKLNIKTTFLKVLLLLMLFTGLTANTYGQEHGVYQVKFEFYHSLRIPNHHVSVEFQRYGESISVHVKSEPMKDQDSKWNDTKLDTTFELTKSDFDKIVEVVAKINCSDIVSGLDFTGLDGTTCEITYGSYAAGVSYKVWSPDYDTKKRNLEEYLEACKLILVTANLDPKEIL